MSFQEGRNEVEVQQDCMRSFCDADECQGILVEMDSQGFNEDQECNICFESLKWNKYALIGSCSHIFCESCIKDWRLKHRECPLCRVPISTVWRFDNSRKPLHFDSLKSQDHMFCESKISCPYAREYLSKLQGDWCRLFVFITRTQIHKDVYKAKGIEHLKLKKYEDEGRMLSKGESYATLKTESGKIQVLVSCQIPCLSIKLMITANEDDIPVEADNEYADTAVRYLTAQTDACWKVLPQLFDRMDLIRTFIRQFETHTVTLCLSGIEDVTEDRHVTPMKEQIRNLKQCNFDPSLHDVQVAKFPRLDFSSYIVSWDLYSDCFCNQEIDEGESSEESDSDNDNDNDEKDNNGHGNSESDFTDDDDYYDDDNDSNNSGNEDN